jgi:hypothetical protein
MTFEEILDHAISMLQRRGRLTYGALKRQFQLDDAYLEDLKAELIEGQRLAADEDGRVLVWTGGASTPPELIASPSLHQEEPFAAPHTRVTSPAVEPHKLDRVRAPRVHITYGCEIGAVIEAVEIPFVIEVLSNLAGIYDKSLPHLRDRHECWAEFEALDRVVAEKYGRQTPGLDAIKRSLDDLRLFIERNIKEKRPYEAERSVPEAAPAAAIPDRVRPPRVHIMPDAFASTSAVPIKFTAYYPLELSPEVWDTLLVYAHVHDALDAVQSDSQILLGQQAKDRRRRYGVATKIIERGTEIKVVPEMPGCRCNPPQASFLWLEDWHRIEFRLQASPSLLGFEWGEAAHCRLAFYVGPILAGELKFVALFSTEADESIPQSHDQATTDLYQAIFVSYSHKDKHIVEQLESAYTVLGFDYLRDLKILRSGERWNPAILRKIEEADIFRLCWSRAAKRSKFVEQEWHHALELARESFIRPVYWETRPPKPPPELQGIHFVRLDFIQQPR